MSMTIEVVGVDKLKQYLEAMPSATERILGQAAAKAGEKAHNEALVQISRKYTISMSGTEKDLRLIIKKGSPACALLKASGRTRGALNFSVGPRPSGGKAWTSKTGYKAEIIRGSAGAVSKDYFWLKGKSGNTHLFRRVDRKADPSKLRIYKSVSTPQMLGNKDVFEKVESITRQTLEEVFARNMQRHLTKG